jgi:hypothetical protein
VIALDARQTRLERLLGEQLGVSHTLLRKKESEMALLKRGTFDLHADIKGECTRTRAAVAKERGAYDKLKRRIKACEQRPLPFDVDVMQTNLADGVDLRVR